MEQTLMAAVGAGQLVPGRDYTADLLARAYAADPCSVDTALRALASDGVFTAVAGGFRLAAPSVQEFRELRDLRALIEVRAVRDAVDHGVGAADLHRLRVLAAATGSAAEADDLVEYIRADLRFHLHLVGLGSTEKVVEIVRVLRIRGGIHGVGDRPAAFMKVNAEEHAVLVGLVGEGDALGAADLLGRHIARLDAVMSADEPARPEH